MRIVHEKADKENFLEFSITDKEHELIKNYMIISKTCYIEGGQVTIGIKLEIDREIDEDVININF